MGTVIPSRAMIKSQRSSCSCEYIFYRTSTRIYLPNRGIVCKRTQQDTLSCRHHTGTYLLLLPPTSLCRCQGLVGLWTSSRLSSDRQHRLQSNPRHRAIRASLPSSFPLRRAQLAGGTRKRPVAFLRCRSLAPLRHCWWCPPAPWLPRKTHEEAPSALSSQPHPCFQHRTRHGYREYDQHRKLPGWLLIATKVVSTPQRMPTICYGEVTLIAPQVCRQARKIGSSGKSGEDKDNTPFLEAEAYYSSKVCILLYQVLLVLPSDNLQSAGLYHTWYECSLQQ